MKAIRNVACPQLETLILGIRPSNAVHNNIGVKGAEFFCESQWPALKHLDLCIFLSIQPKTR